jgi:RNA polymerase primary sigma factor
MTRDELITSNLGLVWKFARLYGHGAEDAYSAGVEGLIHAADKFDSSRGIKFSTFACILIKQYININMTQARSLVHVPRGTMTNRRCSAAVQRALGAGRVDIADAPLEAKSLRRDLDVEDSEFLDAALSILSERERMVVDKYYFYDKTLQEIGDMLGVCKERVRQVLKNALEKMHDCA